MLTRMGHVIDAVENGAEAVAAVKAKDYDVVLMDMQMPVMDGPQATREIRKSNSPRARVPIIALTADVIASHRTDYFASGVNAIVGKPIDWAELSDEIERQLNTRDKVSEAKPQSSTEPESPKMEASPRARLASDAAILDEIALGALNEALGEDTLAPMLKTFRANMHQYQQDLEAAMEAGDFKQAKRTAHALKGLCAQFGAARASRFAKFIEMEALSLADVGPILPELAEIIAATDKAFAARRAKIDAMP